MSSIDSRIVEMKFDNSKFERGVATTMGTLGKLKSALSFGKSTQSMSELQTAADRFSMGGMGAAVTGVSGKFVALATVAITALSNITNRAVNAGIQLGKSLTIDPIMDGFREYELNMNSIQTVLANTSKDGVKLKDVNNALDELNTYADKTIYNFAEMTKNIGTFTAAGVDLDTSVSSIKGIANLAAISGSNSQQASTAMYQLSQAIATGSVKLMDWNSVVNAGMGGEVFQEALFESGKAMGTLADVPMDQTFDEWTKKGNSFRESLQEGWITGEVLTNTLEGFTGDLTDAQLKSMGYNKEQIKSIQKMGKMGTEAATKVKTMTQLIDTLREGVGSGWAKTWQTIFGDFEEAKSLFTGVSEVLGGFIEKSSNSRNELLKGWKDLGGRTALIETISNAWDGLLSVLRPIGKAFREVFPKTTAKELYNMTVWLRDLTEKFKMGGETAENLKRTFRGVFSIFSIGWQILKGVAGVIFDLIGIILGGTGGLLNFTGSIGDFFYKIDQNLKNGKGLVGFFEGLSSVLGGLAIGFSKAVSGISDFVSEMGLIEGAKDMLQGFWDLLVNFFKDLGPAISDAFKSNTFDGVMDLFKVGLLGGIAILLKRFFSGGLFNFEFGGGGMFDAVTESFEGLTGTLKSMQNNLNAKTLLTIAGAVGILTLSVIGLSMIDSKKLAKSLTAMTVGFGQLLGAMAILSVITGMGGFLKIPFIAGSMILLASALLILSAAVTVLSKLSWEELSKGLLGVGALLAMVSAAVIPLSKNSKGMIATGVGLTAIAIALNIMVQAVEDLAKLSWKEMGKGLAGVAAMLLLVSAAMRVMPKGMFGTAMGLLAVGAALHVIAAAIQGMSDMGTSTMIEGLFGIGASLLIIAGAMRLMPKGMLIQAAGLVAVSIALNIMAKAVQGFGNMNWSELGRGLAGLAGSLAILAIALVAMTGTAMGSASLIVAAGALAILVPVLEDLGNMSWGEIAKGLFTLAAALTILGIAGYAINVAALAILGLGAALLMIGAGFALAGAGAMAFASAFAIVVSFGTAGAAVLGAMLLVLIDAIPKAMAAFAQGILQFVLTIVESIPKFVIAFGKIISALLLVVRNAIPEIGATMLVFINTALTVLRQATPRMLSTGLYLIRAFLSAIRDNIIWMAQYGIDIVVKFVNTVAKNMHRIMKAGTNLIVTFFNALSDNMWRIVNAGSNMIVKFLKAITKKMPDVIDAGVDLVVAIIEGIGKRIQDIINAGSNLIIKALEGIAKKMPAVIRAGVDVVVAIIRGIGNNLHRIVRAAANLIIKFLRALQNQQPRIVNEGIRTIISFINGLAKGIRDNKRAMSTAGNNLAVAIIQGMLWGIAWNQWMVIRAVANMAGGAIKAGMERLGINSPSKEFIKIGKSVDEGFVDGINADSKNVEKASAGVAESALMSAKAALMRVNDAVGDEIDVNPVITPVLDLSQVRREAQNLPNVGATYDANLYSSAAAISEQTQLDRVRAQEIATQPVEQKFEFKQYNTSPKALSEIEIYRNTKNQLSAAKGALTT